MAENEQSETIRLQVEFYFSDENLSRPDRFLLGKMHGRKNRPIALNIIHGFKKMREFQPAELVVSALQDSKFLDLVRMDDLNWGIKRKTPFILNEVKGGKTQQGGKKPKVKPTGFEEFYADAPVDPETFEEEISLYDSSRSFVERIETAIQRFQAKRRFHSHPKDMFDKFMRFGGIDSGQKQFTGSGTKAELEDKSAAEILSLTATNFVGDDKEVGEGQQTTWVVDFEAVAKGFLSSHLPFFFECSPHEVYTATNILQNFYNYLLHHNVCPEYETSILAARKICGMAKFQLDAIFKATPLFPGKFNMACSTLFGGHYSNLYVDPKGPGAAWIEDEADFDSIGLSMQEGKTTIAVCLAAATEMKSGHTHLANLSQTFWKQKVIQTEMIGLEVTAIQMPKASMREMFDTVSGLQNQEPVGILRARTWDPPDFAQADIATSVVEKVEEGRTYEFWVEKSVLDCCFEGMKIEASVRTLSSGLTFFDNVTAIKCSFYSELPNELLRKWKEPRWLSRAETLARLNGSSVHMGGEEDGDEIED